MKKMNAGVQLMVALFSMFGHNWGFLNYSHCYMQTLMSRVYVCVCLITNISSHLLKVQDIFSYVYTIVCICRLFSVITHLNFSFMSMTTPSVWNFPLNNLSFLLAVVRSSVSAQLLWTFLHTSSVTWQHVGWDLKHAFIKVTVEIQPASYQTCAMKVELFVLPAF